MSHNHDNLEDWFQWYRKLKKQKGILDTDTYNFDETGFRIGIGRDQWVVTREPERPPSIRSSSNRELITLVECVSGDSLVLPPMLIAPGTLHMEDWYTKTSIPDAYLVGGSESGYSNEKLALDWIRHFNYFSSHRRLEVGDYFYLTGIILTVYESLSPFVMRETFYCFAFPHIARISYSLLMSSSFSRTNIITHQQKNHLAPHLSPLTLCAGRSRRL